jgi:hypothetical protein
MAAGAAAAATMLVAVERVVWLGEVSLFSMRKREESAFTKGQQRCKRDEDEDGSGKMIGRGGGNCMAL